MTLTIEVPPEVQSALAAKAAQLGVPLERYAAGVLQRDVESNGGARVNAERDNSLSDSQSEEDPNPIARALALRDELGPSIRAGTRRSDTPLDAAADLAILREERFADAS
jgi:hypothetical protein